VPAVSFDSRRDPGERQRERERERESYRFYNVAFFISFDVLKSFAPYTFDTVGRTSLLRRFLRETHKKNLVTHIFHTRDVCFVRVIRLYYGFRRQKCGRRSPRTAIDHRHEPIGRRRNAVILGGPHVFYFYLVEKTYTQFCTISRYYDNIMVQ